MKTMPTKELFRVLYFFILSLTLFQAVSWAQEGDQKKKKDDRLSGFKFRNIGPAFMSGRVSDIAIHPKNQNIWYVAIGSGGVWKTENSGVTWKSIFDNQSVYSIGCVFIDPHNPHKIWVGTGENVGGRHVGYGDGLYVSQDDGKTWKNMGLKKSQHISKVIVHPKNPKLIWVAVQGPLWSSGGQRGLYKSNDGGQTWIRKLGDSQWTGVTDILMDPRNSDIMYAATWQRHRTVAAYMGGGKKSGIYKSIDGGETWMRLKGGLPKSKIGKIGLAISPQNPDVLYAAIELNNRKGGIYRSNDRGASWKKMSETVSGGTGPHYYQELYASPHKFDRIYLADVRMQISEDGGKTFYKMKEKYKHSDNHALAFRDNDPNYLLVGSDGGLYESFDLGENWRMMSNIPTLQYYKVAVDDALPFYNIYGGTQDNYSHAGPSRTDNIHGIRNADWSVPIFADGHQPATEPGNPNIVYFEWQQGNLIRFDKTTGEVVYIKPQPDQGEPYERFNWDAPILVSPHKPSTLYFASQRVWKSKDRGDSWTAISKDLTKNQERRTLPIMGKKQSWDSPWDTYAMSNYNTITSLAESSKKEGLIYVGTDDGLIQVTADGGKTWKKIELSSIRGIPATAFVNDIKADLFDENTVYVALDNHKYGDFKPYLIKSTDKGKTWRKISANLPSNTLVWRLEQDHIEPNLLFLATEFGIYVTVNGGKEWNILNGGVPTISFRDLKIQRREQDLVAASFGRGFFILDDYTALRKLSGLDKEKSQAHLFKPRAAWWYIPKRVIGYSKKANQGADYYTAPNPDFGVTFTYYLKDKYLSKKEARQKKEKAIKGKDISFPGWDKITQELETPLPQVWMVIQDQSGETIRKILCANKKGFNRISWDLKYPSFAPIELDEKNLQIVVDDKAKDPSKASGFLAPPGTYTAQLFKKIKGVSTSISPPVTFEVRRLNQGGYLKGKSIAVVSDFWRELEDVQQSASSLQITLTHLIAKINALQLATIRAKRLQGNEEKELNMLRDNLLVLYKRLLGNTAKNELKEKSDPTLYERIYVASMGTTYSTYGPTPLLRKSLNLAKEELSILKKELRIIKKKVDQLGEKLQSQGAPWVEGLDI